MTQASRAGVELNVLSKGAQTGVFVTRGSVRMRGEQQQTPVVVAAGEASTLSAQGIARDAIPVDDSRLRFDSPLSDVAAIFNAHNTVPQLVIVGEARTRQIGGLVQIHKPENLALALRELGDYTLDRRGNSVTIRLRAMP